MLRWVVLPKTFGAHCVPSLYAWLNHHRTSVRGFCANYLQTSGSLNVALALFAKPGSCLTAITLETTCAPTLYLLSVMTSITTCDLLAPSEQPLDLTPLQALPSLGSLLLESGAFSNIHVLAHLTDLMLMNASASAHKDCSFASELRSLALDNATVQGFHRNGLVACRELQVLACYGSAVETIGAAEILNTCVMSSHFPASFSLLTSLSEVKIGLSKLTNFVSLTLNSCAENMAILATIDVNWLCMPKLKVLTLLRCHLVGQHIWSCEA